VPLPNRHIYFSRMNTYAQDVLRLSDPEGYSYVTSNLLFPEFWDKWVEENEHLKSLYYDDGDDDDDDATEESYRPQGCAATGKSAADEVLRFHWNAPAHTARVARHILSPGCMKFTVTDTSRTLCS
jgi:hypothetical protein